jgi:hypothetical protein
VSTVFARAWVDVVTIRVREVTVDPQTGMEILLRKGP